MMGELPVPEVDEEAGWCVPNNPWIKHSANGWSPKSRRTDIPIVFSPGKGMLAIQTGEAESAEETAGPTKGLAVAPSGGSSETKMNSKYASR